MRPWAGGDPDGFTRLVVATADPATLPDKATWYLATNLPRPGGPRETASMHPAATLAEVTRIYGIRHWIEQSYKQARDQLGWADFQVRSDTAIRRHQALVNCAFSFCWAAWFAGSPPRAITAPRPGPGRRERGAARRHRVLPLTSEKPDAEQRAATQDNASRQRSATRQPIQPGSSPTPDSQQIANTRTHADERKVGDDASTQPGAC